MTRIIVGKYNPSWGSHIPVLLKGLEISEGPVLELGMGVFSTPLLHVLCEELKRPLTSYESDPYYVERHVEFKTDMHQIHLATDWDKVDLESTEWGMVFVDHAPDLRRSTEARRLANIAKIVILHDTDPRNRKFYYYDEIYPLYKYRLDYTKRSPNTTILSNFVDVSKLDII